MPSWLDLVVLRAMQSIATQIDTNVSCHPTTQHSSLCILFGYHAPIGSCNTCRAMFLLNTESNVSASIQWTCYIRFFLCWHESFPQWLLAVHCFGTFFDHGFHDTIDVCSWQQCIHFCTSLSIFENYRLLFVIAILLRIDVAPQFDIV